MMVDETSRFAGQTLRNETITRRRYSRLNDWHPIDMVDLKKLIGIIYLMGIHSLPALKDYWSTDVLYNTSIFKNVMPRHRYPKNILKFWHFSDNEAEHTGRLYKVDQILKYFNVRMATVYLAEQHLALDESMVLWRG